MATVYAYISDAGSGVNDASVAVSLDGAARTGCTIVGPSVYCDVAGMADGAHAIGVSAADNAGNTGSGSGSFTVDTIAPAVTGLSPGGIKNSATQIVYGSFSDSGSGIDSASAQVYMDSATLSGCTISAASISCSVAGLTEGVHNYTVSVRDAAGNAGSASSSFTVDTTGPAVVNLRPAETIASASATVYANYHDVTSGINTASVAVSLDGAALSVCDVYGDGTGNGLDYDSASVDLDSVDTVAPAVTGLTPTGTITSSSAVINGYFSDAGSGIDSATARVYLDSGYLPGCTATASAISCPASGLAEGAHDYTVSVSDAAGNAGHASASFTVDSAAPAITGIQPSGWIRTSSAFIVAYYSDAGSGINNASVRVYVDGSTVSGCTVTATRVSCGKSDLSSGNHTITVGVRDNLGNQGTGSGSFGVDRISPTIGTMIPSGTITTDSATVRVYYLDSGSGVNSAASAVYVDNTPVNGCTYDTNLAICNVYGLLIGSHTIKANILDNAGNAASKIGSFSVSLSNKLGLTLSLNGTPTRNGSTLTVPMKMSNNNKTAYNVRLTAVSLTNGVTVGTVLPYTVSSSILTSRC
ncbi:MAG: hypothetical protein ACYC6Z_06025 [Thermoleophilia bacterium]